MIDTVRHCLGQQNDIDLTVTIPPEHRHDDVREACDGDERWLYAATPTDSETIWLLGGDEDTPYYATKERRIVDAISHETMHIVLSFVEDASVSDQYDDLIRHVLPRTTYMHYYAQRVGDDE